MRGDFCYSKYEDGCCLGRCQCAGDCHSEYCLRCVDGCHSGCCLRCAGGYRSGYCQKYGDGCQDCYPRYGDGCQDCYPRYGDDHGQKTLVGECSDV